MFVDLLGKTRIKLGLHLHTNVSDGERSPEEAARIYAEAGYDAIALTDHWSFGEERELGGIKILSGCEYDVGGCDGASGVYHIVGVGMTSDPEIPSDWKNMIKTSEAKAAEIMRRIKLHNGYAFIAHPAWSLNTPEKLVSIGEFEGIEIYNSVSEWGMSDRAHAGSEIDGIATLGKIVPLLATDDTHYYDGDECRAAVMLEATDMDMASIVRALRAGRFYSTQGPEIHLEQITQGKVRVICSPASKVVFFSNLVWTSGRVVKGENIVEAEYTLKEGERYIRAEVTDAEGKMAWSNIISFE